MVLVWGKTRKHRVPNLGCRGAKSPGWFDVSPKNSARDVMPEWLHSSDEAASHQLPIAVVFSIIQVISVECSNLMQNWMQICCSTLLSHFECDSHTVHMLTQWHLLPPRTSAVKSLLFMHVHSSPLSSAAKLHWCCSNSSFYINNGWTAIYTYT